MNIVPVDFQRDLFESPREEYLRMQIERLEAKMVSVKESSDRVRKKCFATINELNRQAVDLNERLSLMERNICLNKGISSE